MVSSLEKRIMLTKLASKCTSPRSCRLCHGPLTLPNPNAPPTRAESIIGQVDCHPSCLPFACTGCVQKDRQSYGLCNIASSDSRCTLCSEEAEDGWNGRLTTTMSRNASPPASPTSSASSSDGGLGLY
ncbi:hypothetical protein BD324DRAFT_650102 [Kockovaella imperatae]|uniref:Uncharacterized protein n=1 Tax=Kockovaella imperatae TaxID=4999 RepID=A0A1Y1UK74_9TREE|nr:hypothetical protein BD324DRAFT_650102 [Kockovaella imperatae]ORX37525.1 hypothetical protein BD324DRAFT_650102 [Kockovaella imperatae]